MALFENFPWTNIQELNLGWIIERLKKMEDSTVISVNGQTGEVVLYESDTMALPEVDSNVWQIIRTCDNVVCGIHFNKNGNATIVNGNRLIQIYTEDNPPPYPVTSVNGATGDVTLYPGAVVRLPDLTNDQLLNWNFYRLLNGTQRGIQFNADGTVQIINGLSRDNVYTSANPPAYPVTSVEGMTGAVTLFPETEIQFNDIDDPSEHNWKLFSILNSKEIGIKVDDAGRAWIVRDEDEIPIYIQGITDPSDFVDPTSAILEVYNNLATGTQWGIVRRLGNDDVGFVVAYDNGAGDYKGYLKINNQLIQLLTLADIPSTTGVVSVNGETGVVSLTGADIPVNHNENIDVDAAISETAAAIAIIENGDTATHSILKKQFVIWKHRLYKATANIAIDDALSLANLSPLNNGGLNQLNDIIDCSTDITWGSSNIVGSAPVGVLTACGRLRSLRVVFHPTQNDLNAWKTILTLPADHIPTSYITALTSTSENYPSVKTTRLKTDGVLEIFGPQNEAYSLNILYLAAN